MNTQFFRYAVEIEKTGSITKAAQNLFMAQPNLSKAVKEMEEQLGYAVFERTQSGMLPTEKGRNFLACAQNILEQMQMMEAIGEEGKERTEQFRISIPRGSYITKGCTEFVAELDGTHGMEITIQETNSIQAINNTAYEQFNLGIIRYQSIYENYFLDFAASKQLCSEELWEFSYLAVMSKAHPLADAQTVTAEELADYIEILHADLMIPYMEAQGTGLHKISHGPKKHVYIYDRGCQFDLLTRIPSSYMWVSPLPESYLEKYGLVQRKCSIPQNRYKDVLVYREGYEFGSLDEKFMQKLYASRDEVAGGHYF